MDATMPETPEPVMMPQKVVEVSSAPDTADKDAPVAPIPVPTIPKNGKKSKVPKQAKAASQPAPKAKVAPKPAKASKKAPSSGQSGPALKLQPDALNTKERKVLAAFMAKKGRPTPLTIAEMAKGAFTTLKASMANSWTRNSLRRLVRGGMLSKEERGKYLITPTGRQAMKG